MEKPGQINGIKNKLVQVTAVLSDNGIMQERCIPYPIRPKVGRLLNLMLPVVQFEPYRLRLFAGFKYGGNSNRSAGLHINQKSELS